MTDEKIETTGLAVRVGRAIHRYRVKRGITQAGLAAKARMSQPHLSEIETGSKHVTLTTLGKLAEALGVDPSWLLK